jgi:LPXTG-site transpeptidase (sortase) family protein
MTYQLTEEVPHPDVPAHSTDTASSAPTAGSNGHFSGESPAMAAGPFDLSAKFIETLMGDSSGPRGPGEPSAESAPLEWHQLTAHVEGRASQEEAIGRSILVAGRMARQANRSLVRAPRQPQEAAPGLSHAEVDLEPPLPVAAPSPEPVLPALEPVPVSLLLEQPSHRSVQTVSPQPLKVLEAPTAVEDTGTSQPMAPRGQKRRVRMRRLASFFGWVQFVGITLILFVVWQLWGTSILQHQAQSDLRQQFLHHVSEAARPGSKVPTLIPADAYISPPAEGSVVARLQIPSIGVDQYVVQGTAEADLEKGPGHYTDTALPGQAGNVSIAGHRTTYAAPFYDLNELAPGDLVILTTDSGESLKYEVKTDPVVVTPSNVSVINNFGDNRITMTTCNPRFSSTNRLVAVAYLITRTRMAAIPASERKGHTGVDTAEDSSGWHLASLPIVLLILALLVVLGIVTEHSKKYFGRHIRWIVIVPLWVAGMYLLFVHLGNLLPATV